MVRYMLNDLIVQRLQRALSLVCLLLVTTTGFAQENSADNHTLSVTFTESSVDSSQSSKLMERARIAIAKAEYGRAIALYDSVIAMNSPEHVQLAYEYQALAHQKARHFALAKAGYQRYLEMYPEGSDSDRVRQRLAVMLTLEQSSPKLKSSTKQRALKSDSLWNTNGGIYQYYRYSSSVNSAGDSEQVLNALSTDLQLSSRYRSKTYDVDVRVSTSYFGDFLTNGPGNSARLSYIYVAGVDRETDRKIKVGRQRQSNGGVIGRFDGLSIESPFAESFSANFVAGFPVDSSKQTSIETGRHFYGFNFDWQTMGDRLDLNLFVITQKIDGMLDRQAIGGQFSYFDNADYLFGLIDYDIHFNELNAFMLNGRHRFENETSVNLSFNIRKSPYLSTRNALIGQPVDSLGELLDTFLTEDEVEDLALDRTMDTQTTTATISHPLNNQYDINGSVTLANNSDTPTSGGVIGIEASDSNIYYSTELLGRGVFVESDISIFGIRYSNLGNSTVTSAYTTLRLPLWPEWRINPRLRIDFRENTNGTEQLTVSPTVQLQYRPARNMFFELETGALLYDQDTTLGASEQFQIYFFYLGYRYIF
ncbi:MAG: hypothetical protein KUG72_00500 [Pseudomonadales bacterium]|nr:hypothetical protein [Pseudomonadales bacterium]